MSDLIHKGKLFNALANAHDKGDIFAIIQKAPTVDAVEVVRCIDCKYHEDEEPGMVYCPHITGGWAANDFFCATGERRNDD